MDDGTSRSVLVDPAVGNLVESASLSWLRKPARLGNPMSLSNKDRKLRIIVAKPGLDGHDRGAKIVARALRDAGFEVIYTGLHQTPEMIVATAIQEDADAIGLSVMSGAHMTLLPAVIDLLREKDAGDVVVFGGGIIPQDDVPKLKERGVAEVFPPGSTTQTIIEWIRQNIRPRAEAA